MKRFLIIISILLLKSCSLSFGERKDFKKNSKEALPRLKSQLWMGNDDEIANWFFFMDEDGIDPYYFAIFETDNRTIDGVIKKLCMVTDTANCPENFSNSYKKPNWFNINALSCNTFTKYVSELPSGKKTLYVDRKKNSLLSLYYLVKKSEKF